mgnify:FL=1
MCRMIVDNINATGSAKGREGWFSLTDISVSYDHPFHAPFEHALNIDFMAKTGNSFNRISAELTAHSARELIASIERVLLEAEARNISLEAEVLRAS